MLLAGIGEGEAEIDETGGKIFERDGGFLPGVPVAGGVELSGADFLTVRGDCDRCALVGGGITEGHFLTAIETEAMILGPMRMIDGTEELMVGAIENLGAVVGGVGLGLDGSGMEAD